MTLITLIVSGISIMRAKRFNKNEISTLILNKYLKPVAIFIVIMPVMTIPFVLVLNS